MDSPLFSKYFPHILVIYKRVHWWKSSIWGTYIVPVANVATIHPVHRARTRNQHRHQPVVAVPVALQRHQVTRSTLNARVLCSLNARAYHHGWFIGAFDFLFLPVQRTGIFASNINEKNSYSMSLPCGPRNQLDGCASWPRSICIRIRDANLGHICICMDN
jgi:hypothetical protein